MVAASYVLGSALSGLSLSSGVLPHFYRAWPTSWGRGCALGTVILCAAHHPQVVDLISETGQPLAWQQG